MRSLPLGVYVKEVKEVEEGDQWTGDTAFREWCVW